MSCSFQTDELAHLEERVSVSYSSLSFSGVGIAALLLVIQQAGHLHKPFLRECARSNAFTWCPCSWTKVAMRRGASEYSSVFLRNYLGLAWPPALVDGMPMRRTLYFKPCACLLTNQAYKDPKSHRLWRQAGDALETRECRPPNMGVAGRFLQPLCSSVVMCPHMPLTMHAGRPRCWIKGCESYLQLNHQLRKFCSTQLFPLSSRKTCGEDLAGVGAGLGWDWEPLVCYSRVGGSGQMVVGAWDRNSKVPRHLPGCMSSLFKIHMLTSTRGRT